MKFIFAAILLISISSSADMKWECQAYCWQYTFGPVLLRETAQHPLKALEALTEQCLGGQNDVALDIQPLTTEPFPESDEATVENSCKIVDPTIY